MNGARLFYKPNFHHHFHPEKSPTLLTAEGLAVRSSRIQKVNFQLHDNYHNLFHGPPLPENVDEAFRIAVLSAAGVMPHKALDVSARGEYKVTGLNRQQFAKLSRPEIVQVEGPGKLALFMADYAAQQEIDEVVDKVVIDEFLSEDTTKKRKKTLASFILAEALDISLEPLNRSYRELKNEGYLTTKKPETFRKVAKRLIRRHSLPHFSKAMETRFAGA